MHLELQILIKIFVTSSEMNPSVLHGTGLDQDSLRGKKINQYKSVAFYFAASKFGTHLIVQICYLTITVRARVFYKQIVNEAQPS